MKVLFVCSGNSYRSPVAEALLKKYASKSVEVDSAGTSAITWISDQARRFLERENAAKYLKKHPEDLGTKNLQNYDLIIAMELQHKFSILRRCPQCADRVEVWNIDDPYNTSAEYEEEVYEQIKAKVKELAERIGHLNDAL